MISMNPTIQHDDPQREELLARLEADYEFHTARLTQMDRTPPTDAEEAFTRDSLAAASRRALTTIAAALRDVVEGRYGICEGCNGQIPAERMQARPEARYCVSCQARQER